ncbi:hypothetical protein CR513_23455, partial [Mucuna pruriens]
MTNPSRKYWSRLLEDALWVHRTAYRTPLGMSPYRIVFESASVQLTTQAHNSLSQIKIVEVKFIPVMCRLDGIRKSDQHPLKARKDKKRKEVSARKEKKKKNQKAKAAAEKSKSSQGSRPIKEGLSQDEAILVRPTLSWPGKATRPSSPMKK